LLAFASDQRREVRQQRRLEPLIAHRQSQLLLHGFVQQATCVNEAEAAVQNLRHAAANAEQHLLCIGQESAGKLAAGFLGIDARDQRQIVPA
jgi:hypothetical protein